MVIHRILLVLVIIIVGALPAAAQSMLQMYPVADSICRITPQEDNLIVLCQKKIQQRYITLVGVKGDTGVILAAVTLKPIEKVTKDISLTVRFKGINPILGKVETWGYVYDRNQDGKIDYIALVGGAAPVWTDNMPKGYPERNIGLNSLEMELLVGHSSLVFNHWADDNFDGKLDGVIHVDQFAERDWVKRRLVYQSTKCNDEYDYVSSFRTTPGDIKDSVEVYDDGIPYYPIGSEIPKMLGKNNLTETTNILTLLNDAVTACKVGKKLRGMPKKEDE